MGEVEAYIERAGSYASVGRFDQATETLIDGLHAHPNNPTLLARLSGVRLEADDPESALDLAKAAVAAHPGALEASALAHVHFRLGELDEALAASEVAMANSGRTAHSVYLHSLILARLGRHNEASAVADDLLARAPHNPLGHLAHVQGAWYETRPIAIWSGAVALASVFTVGLAAVVMWALQRRRRHHNTRLLEPVAHHLEAALSLAPADSFTLGVSADVLDAKGQWIEGVERCVAAAGTQVSASDIAGLVDRARDRLVAEETTVVGMAAVPIAAAVLLFSFWGFVLVPILAVPIILWARRRRRELIAVVPPGLRNEVVLREYTLVPPMMAGVLLMAFFAFAAEANSQGRRDFLWNRTSPADTVDINQRNWSVTPNEDGTFTLRGSLDDVLPNGTPGLPERDYQFPIPPPPPSQPDGE